MYPGMVNSPETTLTNGISESDTLIYVLDPARVPTPPNLMTLGTGTNAETVKVTEINDSAITVERGFQGIAKSWSTGTVIARNFTEYDYGALKDNIDDLDGRNIPVNKLDATVDPGVSDDSTEGYNPGSLWVNATGKKAFVCTDASTGAAVWEIYTGLGSHLSDYASMQFGARPYISTAAKTYYIDGTGGDDANDGLTALTAFKTWVKALTMIPLFLAHTYTIRIIGNLAETITLPYTVSVAVSPMLIRGDTTTPGSHAVNAIDVIACKGCGDSGITFRYLRSSGAISVWGSQGIGFRDLEPRNPAGNGVYAQSSICRVDTCDFGSSVVNRCINSQLSLVYSVNNSGNAIAEGLYAQTGGVIGKGGTQPTGTGSAEGTANGGVIR